MNDTPRRRHDDEPDYISPAELPRHNFREIKRIWRHLDQKVGPQLLSLNRALFGFQDDKDGGWVNGLTQNLAEMREDAKKSKAYQAWGLRFLIGGFVVLLLDGIHPGWGDLIVRLIGLKW